MIWNQERLNYVETNETGTNLPKVSQTAIFRFEYNKIERERKVSTAETFLFSGKHFLELHCL